MRCLETRDVMDLDRLLWCQRCRAVARNRAGWWGWLGGVIFGACVAAYIRFVIQPSAMLIGGWVGTVLAATWLGQKAFKEIAYGVMRVRNSRAVEATPPEAPPPGSDEA